MQQNEREIPQENGISVGESTWKMPKSGKEPSEPTVRCLIERVRAEQAAEDGNGDTEGDAFGMLMERYLPLIEKTVGRFSSDLASNADREDLRQEALMTFYRAVLTYDLSQDRVQFGLYAQICMTNRMVSCMRRMRRLEAEQSLFVKDETEISAEEGNAADPTVGIAEEERLQHTCSVIRRVLSTFEYTVWEHYVAGKTAKEIAERLCKSEKTVSNAIGRIRKKLREVRSEFDF